MTSIEALYKRIGRKPGIIAIMAIFVGSLDNAHNKCYREIK